MRPQPFNLILLGDPGAGKATQGDRLVKKYPLREFDFGQWLRDINNSDMRQRYKVERTMQKGILAPTTLAKTKFRQVILDTPKRQGVFFNGNPKMVGEARVMLKTFRDAGRQDPLAIYLYIPQAEMLRRIQSRKHQARSDDQKEHLKNRMEYYRKHIRPTVAFLKEHYSFSRINGVGTEAEVFRRLVEAIEKFRDAKGK
jgi:adenylate kinase